MRRVVLVVTILALLMVFIPVTPAYAATVTLRPMGVGDQTGIDYQVPDSTYHWDKVDEETADETGTYVWMLSTPYQRDLYAMQDFGLSGRINSVTIYFRISTNTYGDIYAKPSQKSGSTVTDGNEVSHYGITWTTYSQTYTTNPATGVAYTPSQLDSLQVGVSLYSPSSYNARCTQVYVVVDYTPPVTPTVTTSAATNVAGTTATLNGNVTNTGDENPTVTVYWGLTNGGTTPANWANSSVPTSPSQPQGVASFHKNVTGLSPSTLYYFSAKATNSGGTGWGSTQSFTTLSGRPTVTSQAATNVEETTATWNGNITSIGDATCNYRGFVWDTVSRTDPGNVAPASSGYVNQWYQTGSYGTSAYIYDVTGLTPGTTCYYRACAHNQFGWDYSDTQQTVYTKPGDPTGLTANVISVTQINLTWTAGTGSEKTMVRRKTGSYPTSVSDGTEVYFDTGTSKSDTGLSGGITYYYRAWAWDTNSSYSDGYTQASATTPVGDLYLKCWFEPNTMVIPTNLPDRSGNGNTGTINWGTNPSGVEISVGALESFKSYVATPGEEGVTPPEIFVAPTGVGPTGAVEESTASGLPLYPLFQRGAQSLGWSTPTLYGVMMFIPAIGIGVAVLIATGSLLAGGIVVSMVLGAASGTGIIAWWIPVIMLMITLFGYYVMRSV